MPTWSIIHSRCWKQQIPDVARRHRVLTFDPRGNGGSGCPADPAAYSEEEFAADAVAVLDAAGVARSWSSGGLSAPSGAGAGRRAPGSITQKRSFGVASSTDGAIACAPSRRSAAFWRRVVALEVPGCGAVTWLFLR